MKEASGELSMTAITVVAIAAIAGLFSVFLLPGLKGTIMKKTHCSQAFDCDRNFGIYIIFFLIISIYMINIPFSINIKKV